MALAHGLPAPLWVFSDTADVEPWRPDYVSTHFRRVRNKCGLDSRLHGLRHFMASEALAAGVPLAVVGDRLDHANRARLRPLSPSRRQTDCRHHGMAARLSA